MARLNDIPESLRTIGARAMFYDYLKNLNADLFAKKQLARLWSAENNTTINYADMRAIEDAPTTIK